MLQQLSVQNFALIEHENISFSDGFTVITGETGSGKSILLGALGLILGNRADYSVIRDKTKKTTVEAEFLLSNEDFKPFFDKNDLDFEAITHIRREITEQGKSRAFVNDTPVQLSVLKDLTEQLIHIHSQHHTLALKDAVFQQYILDAMADNGLLLVKMNQHFRTIKTLENEIDTLKFQKEQSEAAIEFNQFQLDELKKLNLDKLDYLQIQKDVERGEQFEEIKNAYGQIVGKLDSEGGVLFVLNDILRSTNVKDDKIQELLERLKSVEIELKDIANTAEDEVAELISDPQKLLIDTQRLDSFNSILRKHHKETQEELIQLQLELTNSVENSAGLEQKILTLNQELTTAKDNAYKIAKEITDKRKKSAIQIEHQVGALLNDLKLNGASIHFKIEETALNATGNDKINLLFAPNNGIAPQLIEKTASGGELSRLMLVFQYLLSQKKNLPCIIFDEIDTGVSGEVAQRIGKLLKGMGQSMQLIAITHLPQVASKGEHHLLVVKGEKNGKTATEIITLNQDERITEIAKLMSGSKINEAALLNAKNLMNE